jgi:cobalt-zinc-cadmium efflux system outer membrane protein
MKSHLNFFFSFVLFLLSCSVFGQSRTDTLSVTLTQTEQQFLQKNLQLLAQRYNINAQRALILQAKLYPNPYLSIEQSTYDPQTRKWFELGRNGEQAVQLSQLILLAHKINKQVKIAETNALLAEQNFADLLRTLRFTLRSDFFAIHYLQQTERVYGQEIQSLQTISTAFEQQRDKGYIARSEVVRIKAQLYSLQNELNDLRNQIRDRQSELRLVLQTAPGVYIVPLVDSAELMRLNPETFPVQVLLDSAYRNRTDLQMAQTNVTLSRQNYEYQKALAVPDLTVGANYDRAGSYVPNFNAVSLGISIPIFNRNQGNIKAYRNYVSQNDFLLQSTQKTIEEQVYRGLERAIDADRLYQSMDKTFTGEFSQLAQAVYENYVKRNITLLDFLNFYDAYKQYMVQLNYILENRVTALENINYLTGTNFFNF